MCISYNVMCKAEIIYSSHIKFRFRVSVEKCLNARSTVVRG